MAPNVLHDRGTNFARRRLSLALAYSIVIQYAATAQAVGGLAILIAALFHMLPECHHLRAELCFARWTLGTLAGMSQEN